MTHNIYQSPLGQRYASKEMQSLFSDDTKYYTWRKLWISLAKNTSFISPKLIHPDQVQEMNKSFIGIDYDRVAEIEKELHHDVMSHLKHFCEQAQHAAPIIHLGATSAYVVDNTDIIIAREALDLLIAKTKKLTRAMCALAHKTHHIPCLSYTHFQPAQPTTFGHRVCLWIEELRQDLDKLYYIRDNLKMLGAKGATGTQASFVELLGSYDKARELDRNICAEFGMEPVTIAGQTYSRKVDAEIVSALAMVAQSAHKFANDMRLLMGIGSVSEPWGSKQVGSSAMPYKKNPMKCERITALSRFVMGLQPIALQTAAEQWFERTLDDSACKRLFMPEAFLATDGILDLYYTVIDGINIDSQKLADQLAEKLPYMATEKILMRIVEAGGDRQEAHEELKAMSYEAKDGLHLANMLKKVYPDASRGLLDPKAHTGASSQQTLRYVMDFYEKY